MSSLVTLVMSDIVGSTRRWAADEASMAADLELHDKILSAAVQETGGNLVKHTGDGMLAVFDDPMSGAEAAAAVQRTIGAADWRHTEALRVRVAVHTGMVFHRDGDVFGTPVNRVARLLDLCPPGAVLVSGVVANLLAERAPQSLGVRAVGEVALAGFSAPEPVHALSGPGLAEVQALEPGATVRRRGGALPALHDELVGRTELLGAVWQALGRSRLVTLVGVGGMGKTRLALEVAAGAAESLADGAWWIDLSVATSAQAVVPVALAAVEAREMSGRTGLQAFTDRFAEVGGLVVFDNCEHVLPTTREVIDALRTAAPEMRILATSREGLGLRGERILPVGSLPQEDAVTLFEERARSIRPDLDFNANRETILRICDRLDGIPLAIELAAARCRSMTPEDIEIRLTERFRLLRGSNTVMERHRTLQAAVAWSYSMLDEDEKDVFDCLAVFSGGALLDGISAVVMHHELDALDLVDRLISRSMVTASETPLGMRYGQLETLRQYAEDRLVEAGRMGEIRERHLAWITALTEKLVNATGLTEEARAFARFSAELDNLRVAIALAMETGRQLKAYETVAHLSLMAYLLPAWDVLDWVRPLRLDAGSSAPEITCANRIAMIDFQRGNPHLDEILSSVNDLPPWYETASIEHRHQFLGWQLVSGGDLNLIADLLCTSQAMTLAEKVRVNTTHLFLAWVQQWGKKLSTNDVAQLHDMGLATVQLARDSGKAVSLGMSLIGFCAAMSAERLAATLDYAREARDLFEKLGAGFFRTYAQRVLYTSALKAENDPETLSEICAVMEAALRKRQVFVASSWAFLALRAISADSPDVGVRLWAVVTRVNGTDRRRELESAGVTLPGDLEDLAKRTAGITLAQAIEDVVVELRRAIARAAIASGAR